MNTLVMIKKEDNSVTMINCSKSLDNFQKIFEEHVNSFMKKIMALNVVVNEANSKITQEDYDSEEPTENLKVFSMHYEQLEKFKKENCVFVFENQFIDMRQWFWNDQFMYEYEIYHLEDYVQKKLSETKKKPKLEF